MSISHRAEQTQPGRNSCPRLQFLAFSLESIMSLARNKAFYVVLISLFLADPDLLQILHPLAAVLFVHARFQTKTEYFPQMVPDINAKRRQNVKRII